MKVFFRILFFFLFFTISCKGEIPSFQESHQNLVSNLLAANETLMEELLKDDPKPNWDDLAKAVAPLANSDHPQLKEWGMGIQSKIPKQNLDLEQSFEPLSEIEIILNEMRKLVPNQSDYYQFYCPMVEKYWVMKGRTVKNPYAPEMRDCGDLILQ
ncbi:hypothetical protein P3G55_00990 [Leptospira sp. 96542]|nr:hypothetical protein [Leptospira sp. 96542]